MTYRQALGSGFSADVEPSRIAHVPTPQSLSVEHCVAHTPAGVRPLPFHQPLTHHSAGEQSEATVHGVSIGRCEQEKNDKAARARSIRMYVSVSLNRAAPQDERAFSGKTRA